MPEDDPLSDLYSEGYVYDRTRLATGLDEIVQVDPKSGEPVRQPRFESLSPKKQSIAMLLYRKVAVELGEIEPGDEAVQMMWLDRNTDAHEHDISGYHAQLAFIDETDEDMRLFVPDHQVDAALDFLDRSS